LVASRGVFSRRPGRAPLVWVLVVAIVGLLFALPLIAMLSGSLRPPGTPPSRVFQPIPDGAGLEAYRQAFALSPLLRALINSAIVAVIFVPIASSAAAAWALVGARRQRIAIGLVLVLFMAPTSLLWIARFIVFDRLGIVGSWLPLLLPALLGGTPFAVLLYLLAFRRLPSELLDAARLDLGDTWQVFRKVAFPLVRGTTVAVGLLAFLASWSAFLEPLLVLHRESSYTAPLALSYLEQLGRVRHSILLAGSVCVALPAVVAFSFAQRRLFTQGGIRWYAG
jgi:multiple sugar transport system permease protein